MKKILLAFDGSRFSEGAFELARWLNNLQPVFLTGVFIPQISYANLWSYSSAMAGAPFIPIMEKESEDHIQENIKRFQSLCQLHNINYSIHKDFYNFALPELKRETRFADLLIISSEAFYKNITGEDNSDYMKDALHTAECPVIVVPEKYAFPQKNILSYDGSESSVFAIKQFAYLFPELCKNKSYLLFINAEKGTTIPDEKYITELVQQHFSDISIQKLDMHPKEFYSKWVSENTDTLLVSGSFSRSVFSQLFRKSFAAKIIAEHALPVFIAHK